MTETRPDGRPPRSKCATWSRSYNGRAVVDGLSFSVQPGEVFALLGPNGAGKTTTVEILEGYRRPGRWLGARAGPRSDPPGRRAQAAHRPDAAAGRPVPADHRARSLAAVRGVLSRRRRPGRAARSAAAARGRRARASVSSRAARNSVSALAWRWSAGRGWCFWTSRPRPWTPRRAAARGTSFAR